MLKTDSRHINKGDIFIAVRGARVDGNNYVQKALDLGASLAVTDKTFNDASVITVPNTLKSLTRLGRYFRTRSNLQITIGITGSCGKTTTRNWIYSVLSKRYNVVQSMHNYNTMLGMALNFELLAYDTEIGIFELGTNSVGEILPLTKYIKPNIAIITNIYEAHIGNFSDIDELTNEKISVIDGMQRHGTLLYDGDCEFKDKILKKCFVKNITPISIGYSKNCDYKINICNNKINVTTKSKTYEYSLKILGRHYAYMSAMVIAVLEVMGLNAKQHIETIEDFAPLRGRGDINEYEYNEKKFKVIDETYNANPSAMLATLECLKQYSEHKVLVIGEMLELGNKSRMYHEKIVQKLVEFRNDKIYFIGSKELWQCIQKYARIKCFECISNEFISEILDAVQNGDILYLKGSRGVGLDKIISFIKCSSI